MLVIGRLSVGHRLVAVIEANRFPPSECADHAGCETSTADSILEGAGGLAPTCEGTGPPVLPEDRSVEAGAPETKTLLPPTPGEYSAITVLSKSTAENRPKQEEGRVLAPR